MVDHRDLARLEPPDQVLGAPVDPGRAVDRVGHVGALARPRSRAISRARRADRARRASASSSAAWLGGRAPSSPMPASMRDSSATRASPSTTCAPRHGALRRPLPSPRSCSDLLHCLLHHHLGVGERRHLREVRDAQHLVPGTERLRARRPTAVPASPPMPGVDLVEHQRRAAPR